MVASTMRRAGPSPGGRRREPGVGGSSVGGARASKLASSLGGQPGPGSGGGWAPLGGCWLAEVRTLPAGCRHAWGMAAACAGPTPSGPTPSGPTRNPAGTMAAPGACTGTGGCGPAAQGPRPGKARTGRVSGQNPLCGSGHRTGLAAATGGPHAGWDGYGLGCTHLAKGCDPLWRGTEVRARPTRRDPGPATREAARDAPRPVVDSGAPHPVRPVSGGPPR
jgi:hypothetical protein